MTTISAKAILVSHNVADPDPDRKLVTLLLRYPRCIHAEFMTHRAFSKNSASSRAIPVKKLIADVLANPFVPLFWGANQKGMQATEDCDAQILIPSRPPLRSMDMIANEDAWRRAMKDAVMWARRFDESGYHKQIVNRLIEPFSHITTVVTASEWDNFFTLRDHPDAEPHFGMLARKIKTAIDEAEVQTLSRGEWHLPFVDGMGGFPEVTIDERGEHWGACPDHSGEKYAAFLKDMIKLSVARCASTSYKTVDGFDMTLERAIELHDKLVNSRPMHASPLEHQAMADEAYVDSQGWVNPDQHRNFVGWRQYRAIIEDATLPVIRGTLRDEDKN